MKGKLIVSNLEHKAISHAVWTLPSLYVSLRISRYSSAVERVIYSQSSGHSKRIQQLSSSELFGNRFTQRHDGFVWTQF